MKQTFFNRQTATTPLKGSKTYRLGKDRERERYRKLKGRQLEDHRNSREVTVRLLTNEERQELGL